MSYGDDGFGVALGFDPKGMSHTTVSAENHGILVLLPITYVDKVPTNYTQTHSKLADFLLTIAREWMIKNIDHKWLEKDMYIYEGGLASYWIINLVNRAAYASFKHSSFCSEQEWHLLYVELDNELKVFHPRRSGLRAQVNIQFGTYISNCLKAIKLGPRNRTSMMQLDEFLLSYGLTDVTISESSCSYWGND